MKKIKYYYDPILKSYEGRYYIDYYCSDGKNRLWSGRCIADTPTATLKDVRNIIAGLNKPRAFFGNCGRLEQWIWWKKQIRNQKISFVSHP
jgi:hypothetical protein